MDIDQILTFLSQAPDGQLDHMVCNDLKELIGKPHPEVKIGVMKALDDCVRGGLASKFAMMVLNDLFYVGLEGKPEDFNDENCPWRTIKQ